MDNFRRRKQKSSFGDTDGFIRRSVGNNTPGRPASLHKPKAYQPTEKAANIDGFKRADGFFPRKPTESRLPDGRALGRKPLNTEGLDMKLNDKKKSKKKKWFYIKDRKKAIKRSLIGLAVVALLVGGFLAGKSFLKLRQVFGGGGQCTILECEIDPSQLKGEGDGRVNILLLGRGGPGHEGPDLTDTILIASIDPINKDAGLLSLPRDLYVTVPGNGSMKLNAVFSTYKQQALAQGKKNDEAEKEGAEAVQKVATEITGIPMHRYAVVDFKGFKKAIDTVGGVDLEVKTPVYEKMAIDGKRYVLDVKTGWQHFDGFRALAYARSRYTSVRGDFDRAERQRAIIVALRNKVLSVGTFGNPAKISGLIDAFGDHVRTNISIDEMKKLYNLAHDIDGSKIKSVSLVDPPHDYLTTANIGGLSIVQPKAGLDNYTLIRRFIRRTFKDGFIRKEDPKIVILNGTHNLGLAKQKAEELKGYGYDVIKVGDAPNKNIAHTILIDLRDGQKKYTKRYLELRFNTVATGRIPKGVTPPENADFVIIVGQK